jgi:ParB family chromosome partitioning protein
LALCGRIQAEGLSVRQAEAAAKESGRPQSMEQTAADGVAEPSAVTAVAPDTIPLTHESPATDERTNHVRSLEEQLGGMLGVRVEIQLRTKDAGAIVVPFASNEEFERILGRLRRSAA